MNNQKISNEIYEKKYQLKTKEGIAIDTNVHSTFQRVASALAECEKEPIKYEDEFLWALENGAIPGGRIIANAGAGVNKSSTSTINCVVSGTIEDSMEGILESLKQGGLTLKTGAGIGYCFSTLRPKGAYIAGAGAQTSGPLSFMDIFDKMCFSIASAGGRRGAQMATFDISHPDIEEYITAKREDGRLRQFNLSVLVSDAFIDAVKNNSEWALTFAGKEYRKVKAKQLWDLIMRSTYEYSEPGVMFIDTVNKLNNLNWCEDIRASNPCGEIYLPPYGSCLLGSINLTKFVENPFSTNAKFNYQKYERVIKIFTRMLDNVVEINGLPIEAQRKELEEKRRHGMGYLGLGSAMIMLGIKYGSDASQGFTQGVSAILANSGYETGIELAKEKGIAPILQNQENLEKFCNSKYIQRLSPSIVNNLRRCGCRFTHHSAIAPTGTISLALANNASNGIEPSFAHSYKRNLLKEGKQTKEPVDVYSYEYLLFREMFGEKQELPDYFITANDIDPKLHINVQAKAQYWIDSAISKTINVPSDYSFEKFKELYMYAYEKGLKGCTTFRYNPERFSGVLVKDEDLAKTKYRFTLENGQVVECTGNEQIKYKNEVHNAANLFDALKEKTFGRF